MPTPNARLNPIVIQVTERVRDRSRKERSEYLARMQSETAANSTRSKLSCGNLAHGQCDNQQSCQISVHKFTSFLCIRGACSFQSPRIQQFFRLVAKTVPILEGRVLFYLAGTRASIARRRCEFTHSLRKRILTKMRKRIPNPGQFQYEFRAMLQNY